MTMEALDAPPAASPVRERRHASRRVPDAGEPLVAVRVRGGRELAVIDVSDSGVLVEGQARLLPGTHVEVHVVTAAGRVLVEGQARLLPGTHVEVHVVTTAGRVLVRTRVVRAFVSALKGGIRYRTALAFERTVDTAPVCGPAVVW